MFLHFATWKKKPTFGASWPGRINGMESKLQHHPPRDPITETQNGSMEPKYLSFWMWLYTPCSSSEVRWARILRDPNLPPKTEHENPTNFLQTNFCTEEMCHWIRWSFTRETWRPWPKIYWFCWKKLAGNQHTKCREYAKLQYFQYIFLVWR